MSSCGSGCGCGSSCQCGSGCSCENTSTETLVLGVGPVKAQFDDAEIGVAAENGGCKCGSTCTCDPCNCK
ncbi:Metallothionein protein [Spatholobus suberectus]|nr:Metallothionein protein [Spatholobus suberectus]